MIKLTVNLGKRNMGGNNHPLFIITIFCASICQKYAKTNYSIVLTDYINYHQLKALLFFVFFHQKNLKHAL